MEKTRTDVAFPFSTPDPACVPGEYARLRRESPVSRVVLPTGDAAWLVTRHADVVRVLTEETFSRHALTEPDAPHPTPVPPFPSLFYLDPPEHTRIVRLARPSLTGAGVERFSDRVERAVTGTLDDLAAAGPGADFMDLVARPLPLAVLCPVIGVPEAERERFATWLHTAFSIPPPPPRTMMTMFGLINGYVQGLIASRRGHGEDDLLTDLLTTGDDGDRLTNAEVFSLLFDLIGAGDMPVTAEIAHLVVNLTRRPEVLRTLNQRPDLVPTAVEELLRFSQSAGGGVGSARMATTPVELDGQRIEAGELVIPSLSAANLDETVFPDGFDTSRDPNPHLSFGSGIHHCIGAALGRMELRILVSGLASRFPGLRLEAANEELEWSPGPVFRTPVRMAVRW